MNYQHKEQLRELVQLIDKRIVEKLMIDKKENSDPNISQVVQDLINFKIRIGLLLKIYKTFNYFIIRTNSAGGNT